MADKGADKGTVHPSYWHYHHGRQRDGSSVLLALSPRKNNTEFTNEPIKLSMGA